MFILSARVRARLDREILDSTTNRSKRASADFIVFTTFSVVTQMSQGPEAPESAGLWISTLHLTVQRCK